ncbi:MAG: hypothetical protein EBT09_06615 [Actinobacteria bacterium]|nr:hypothetical protein [Actinomycetota bacterium]
MRGRAGRPPGSTTRHSEQRLSDRSKLAGLYLHGVSTTEMAVRVGLTRRTVQAELVAIRDDWKGRTQIDFESAIAQQLDRVDLVEKYAFEGWERSLTRKTVETKQAVRTVNGQVDRATLRAETGNGDPAFLARMSWCIEQRCRILGLEKPREVTIQGTFVDIAMGLDWTSSALQGST